MKQIIPSILTGLLALSSCNSGQDYDATGIFESTTVTVSAETSGKILSLNLTEGDTIEAGIMAGAIDTTLLVLQRKQLAGQIAALESSRPDISRQIESLRQQIAQQENECRRIANLLDDGAATQKQADDAEAGLRILQGQLAASISSLSKNSASITDNSIAMSHQMAQIDEQISRCRISSPITGTVIAKYAEPGEFAATGRPLFKVADMDNVYLRAYFTSTQLADIHTGQKVTVIADYGADRQFEYPGTIIWIADESEFTPKSVQTRDTRADLVYAVKIAVKTDGHIKLGMYGEVRL